MKPLLPEIIVNDEIIPAQLIAAEAQNHPAASGKPGQAWLAAARALVVRSLLLQEARRRNLLAEPQEIASGQWETEDEALVRQLLDTAIDLPAPSEADLEAFYLASPERFLAPDLYEVAHILIAPAGDGQQARQKAEALLAEVLADPRRFEQLARAHSSCASKSNGGRLGQISAGETVAEFEAALAEMREGEINPSLVQTRYGLHIIRLDARALGKVLPFASVKSSLRVAQEKVAWLQASRNLIASLAAKAKITGIALAAT